VKILIGSFCFQFVEMFKELKPRTVFLDGVYFLLWILICFFDSTFIKFNVILSSFGVVFGLGLGILIACWQTRSIETKGEYKTTLKTLMLTLLVGVPMVFCLVFLLFSYGSAAGVPMVSFLLPAVPANYAAKIIFSLKWEKKNKMIILYDLRYLNRIYATPKDV
jgi:peptidoglycan/LPS O-acetylase OafA/YrhL